MSGVSSRGKRDAIRTSWFQWSAFASEAVGCFVLARRAALSDLTHADEWEGRLADVLWLDEATEGCAGITFTKTLAYWKWAASLPQSVSHVVKSEVATRREAQTLE